MKKQTGTLSLIIVIILLLFLPNITKQTSAETEELNEPYGSYIYRTGIGNNSLYAIWEINETYATKIFLFTQNQFSIWNETVSGRNYPDWIYYPPSLVTQFNDQGSFRINTLNKSELYYFVICKFAEGGIRASFNLTWYNTPAKMISTPMSISNSGSASSPAIAVQENGNVHVVWDDETSLYDSGIDRDIFYRSWNATTGVWTGITLISNNSTQDSFDPAIAVDNCGNVHIIWTDLTNYTGSGSDKDIFYKYWNASTNNWSETQVISTESTVDSLDPAIAIDGKDNIHVTWVEDSVVDLVSYKFLNATSHIWSGQINSTDQIFAAMAPIGLRSPEIAADSDGNVFMAWAGNNFNIPNGSIYFKYWNLTTKNWIGYINATDWITSIHQNKTSYSPHLALDTFGGIHLTWQDTYQLNETLISEIFYIHWNSTSKIWQGNVNKTDKINTNTEPSYSVKNPSITIDADNNIHILWTDDTPVFSYSKPGYSDDLYYRYWNASKKVWEPMYEVTRESVQPSREARIGVDGSGNLHVVWSEGFGPTNIQYKMIKGGYFESSSITHPVDHAFLHDAFKNTTGNEITWMVVDLWPYIQPIPQSYHIYNITDCIQSGSWISGDNLTINYDNCEWGINNFTLIIDDGWRILEDSVSIVLDTLPTLGIVDNCDGKKYVQGEAVLKITFNVGGCFVFNNPTYIIFENGVPIFSGEYTEYENTTYVLNALGVGKYNYTLVVDNGYGFTASYEMHFEITQPLSFYLIIIVVIAIIAVGILAGYFYLKSKGIGGKRTAINIFISHAVSDFEEYEIENFSAYLEKNKAINKVYYCEKDIRFDIDQWMDQTIPKCQILLFIATENSLNSKDCARELRIARENDLSIIPVKGKNLNWSDLSPIKLERQFGFEFDKEILDEFKKNLFGYISKFKDDLDSLLKFLNKSSIAYINVMKSELNLSIEQIRTLISTLIQLNKIQGVWSKDHNKFLREDEVLRVITAVDPRRNIKDVKKLVDLAEISPDSIDVMKNILEKKGWFKKS